MRLTLRLVVLTITLGLGMMVDVTASAKCARHRISISGKVLGTTSSNLHIVVIATFSQGSPVVAITDPSQSQFQTSLLYDTYKAGGFFHADNCSRRPDKVTVVLFESEEEINRLVLDLKRDFTFVPQEGEYRLRSPLDLSPPERDN